MSVAISSVSRFSTSAVRLLFRHAVLLQGLNALFHFALQLRESDDAVIDLGDNFVDDDRFAFLGAGRGGDNKQNAAIMNERQLDFDLTILLLSKAPEERNVLALGF